MRGPLGDGVQTLSAHEGLSCSDVSLNCHTGIKAVSGGWRVFRMTGHSGEGHQCFTGGQ